METDILTDLLLVSFCTKVIFTYECNSGSEIKFYPLNF